MKKISLFLLVLVSLFMITGCKGNNFTKYDVSKDISFTKLEGNQRKTQEEIKKIQNEKIKKYDLLSYKLISRELKGHTPGEYRAEALTTKNVDIKKLADNKFIYSIKHKTRVNYPDESWLERLEIEYYVDGIEYLNDKTINSDQEEFQRKIKKPIVISYDEIVAHFNFNLGDDGLFHSAKQGYLDDGNFIIEYTEASSIALLRTRMVFKDGLLVYCGRLFTYEDKEYEKYETVYTYGKAKINVLDNLNEYESLY